MLTSLTLVSPHQDDAAFSLAECVRRLVAGGVRVRVVNCYTRSAYAPHRAPGDERPVVEIRAEEDRAALRALGVTDVVDLGQLDAPLRLGAALDDVCDERLRDARAERDAAALADVLAPALGASCVLAPLAAPGAHVDHWVAHRAARLVVPPDRLAFYEELPYATRVSAETLATAAHALDADLSPVTMTTPDGGAAKRAVALRYASQITAADLPTLDVAGRRGFAERVWVAPSGVDLRAALTH